MSQNSTTNPSLLDPVEGFESDESTVAPSNADLAHDAADRLDILARVARNGLVVLGGMALLLVFMVGIHSQREVLLGLLAFVLLLLAAVVGNSILRGFAALLRLSADQAEVTLRLEKRLATMPLGRNPADPTESAAEVAEVDAALASHERAVHLFEIRRATREGQWSEAAELLTAFGESHHDDPELPRLQGALTEAREAASGDLRARLEAAREVNDGDRVIELRDALKPLLEADAVRALDLDLSRWFLKLIQRRLRTGTVRADVAELAARVAESLGATAEGASLRASLPTLRRAAGLCARCGQPYSGLAAACSACLAGAISPPRPAATAVAGAPVPHEEPDGEPDEPSDAPNPFDDPGLAFDD